MEQSNQRFTILVFSLIKEGDNMERVKVFFDFKTAKIFRMQSIEAVYSKTNFIQVFRDDANDDRKVFLNTDNVLYVELVDAEKDSKQLS